MDEPIPAESIAGDLLLRAAEEHHETMCAACQGLRRLVRVRTNAGLVLMLFCRCLTSSPQAKTLPPPAPCKVDEEPDPLLGL